MMMQMIKKIIVALGGNAFLKTGQKGTIKQQINTVRETCKQISRMIQEGYQVTLTTGNGPQVGALALQNEIAKKQVPPMPLDVLVAESQGLIGYLIQQQLMIELKRIGLNIPVTTLLTQVLVNKNDPAFKNPTKPIGPYYPKKTSKNMIKEVEGWRRVVPSPKPKSIIEIEEIKTLVKKGVIVIACGGGGIPVVKKKGKLVGVEAVIDKDYASQKLAIQLKAECLIFLTDVKYVYLNYEKKDQKPLRRITLKQAKRYLKEGHFKEGSMKPKIEASLNFLKSGGKKVIITNVSSLKKALKNKSGTIITSH